MKPLFTAITASLLFFLVISALGSGQAQTAVPASKTAGPMSYDVSEEATLNGTLSAVLTTPSPGMLAGSHLLLTTLSGSVDVSVGAFALRGKGALSVNQGRQVEVTGVMKTFRGNQVFLARSVKVSNFVYLIRNEHGIPVTPQARQRANQNSPSGDKQ